MGLDTYQQGTIMKRFVKALAFAVALIPYPVMASDDEDIAKATAAAESWLLVVDAGKYGASWDNAATMFQKAVSKDQWEQAVSSARAPLGPLKSRKPGTGAGAPKLRKTPQGDAVVIQFASAFEKAPAVTETVSPIREADGSWKVAGYLVQPSASPVPSAEKSAGKILSDTDIREILREHIDVAKKGVGIVVGIVDDKGPRIISYGKKRRDGNDPVDGDTVFEIGSVTKTFTSLLLADMVEKGEVKLDDPVSKYLPASIRANKVKDKEITLANLSRHTSGLPNMPDNFVVKNPDNPHADYAVKEMYSYLDNYKSTREIGAYFEYSNLGVGLLAHALALRAGSDYEALLRKRVLQPLKMNDTAITLTPEMKSRLAGGHRRLMPVANWDLPTLAGAGALRSTAKDMLKYLAANLDLIETPLRAAMQLTHKAVVVDRRLDEQQMGLGWFIVNFAGTQAITHNGATGGYRAFAAIDKKNRRGVVVLANSNATDVDNIGAHLVDSGFPLTKVLPAFQAIKLDPVVFDRYIGTYQSDPDRTFVFSREGNRFFGKYAEEAKVEIFADSATHFSADDVDAEVTFVNSDDPAKGVSHVVLRLNGRDVQARKIK